MPCFQAMPVEEALQTENPAEHLSRSQIREMFEDELKHALDEGKALVVTLQPGDRPFTIRGRIKSAAKRLGLEHVNVRITSDEVIAYQ